MAWKPVKVFREKRERFKNHMHSMNRVMQSYHATMLADQIVDTANRRVQRTGQVLYACLPHEAAMLVCKSDIDPYKSHWNEWVIRQWLEDHVVFNSNGDIIAVRDDDEWIYVKPGWSQEVDMYAQLRSNNG